MGDRGLNQRVPRRFECVQEWCPLLPNALSVFLLRFFSEAPLPDDVRECAVTDRALASNLEVFGRGLAAIGNLFVFYRLSFIECRKTSFLDRRNMNKNVLAATGGLDESKSLGRVEPLHSTFSHHVVSAGSKTIANCRFPANRPCPRRARYAV